MPVYSNRGSSSTGTPGHGHEPATDQHAWSSTIQIAPVTVVDGGAGNADLFIDGSGTQAASGATTSVDLFIDGAGSAQDSAAATSDLYIDALTSIGAAAGASTTTDLFIDAASGTPAADQATGGADLYLDALASTGAASDAAGADLFIDAAQTAADQGAGGADLYVDGSGTATIADGANADLYVDAAGDGTTSGDQISVGTAELYIDAETVAASVWPTVPDPTSGGSGGFAPRRPKTRKLTLDDLLADLVVASGTSDLGIDADGDATRYGTSDDELALLVTA